MNHLTIDQLRKRLKELEDSEQELVCPYCGDYLPKNDDCCGEYGHGELMWVVAHELMTDHERNCEMDEIIELLDMKESLQ